MLMEARFLRDRPTLKDTIGKYIDQQKQKKIRAFVKLKDLAMHMHEN